MKKNVDEFELWVQIHRLSCESLIKRRAFVSE